jgi:hypothetical protein
MTNWQEALQHYFKALETYAAYEDEYRKGNGVSSLRFLRPHKSPIQIDAPSCDLLPLK